MLEAERCSLAAAVASAGRAAAINAAFSEASRSQLRRPARNLTSPCSGTAESHAAVSAWSARSPSRAPTWRPGGA
ncbi:hypothetical protein ZWY2020_038655 [Hordeum vulgare]|nr:hypothetical protein ZWY2020_008627 [Hordeum vulgare]KAI4990292.1 hypothetical protein ZWY2020_038655 [Hordeum vulgare]